MSKLSPPPTSIESPSRALPASKGRSQPQTPSAPKAKTWNTQFAAAVRWLHIYVSLLGFTSLLFFAVTGVTLNHPTWFGVDGERVTQHTGKVNIEWLNRSLPAGLTQPADGEEVDYSLQVAKLEVVEHLRNNHKIRGSVGEFRVDERECSIIFKGPGYAADAYVDRATGEYQLTETVMGVVAVINDLHKGRDTGLVWSWVIDITALLMVFVSITGIVLIFYLKRKRWSGIITAVIGTIVFALLYVWYVP
ncbi:PepSY-associated TM helix domain-containing protein [Anatilimnocola aggregata]|uniref:PepSY-associated TM helix domain-containing protein n=1 Tax=Anatilimnocola aggregata TaxID=2528021 RepID=UPI00119D0027|nr:PepSY-associated TM helix domain-containing protein [Anatilimnocola aggregata]